MPIAKKQLALAVTILLHGSVSVVFAKSINLGVGPDSVTVPFVAEVVAQARSPWAGAFLPDGRLLVTERAGGILLVARNGSASRLTVSPATSSSAAGGFLDIALGPDFETSRTVYFTHRENESGVHIVLSSATLDEKDGELSLVNRQTLWRQTPTGGGARSGGNIAFDPSGERVFLTLGDTFRPETAQDPTNARGKVLRLNIDGTVPPDNPHAQSADATEARTWTTGHRNPSGLAFASDGKLWSVDMGPRGGDELNHILPARNYGWPYVSEGDDYNGPNIPRHDTRPELASPAAHWTPVVSPNGLTFYSGAMFPQWRGSALIGGLSSEALVRVDFNDDGLPFRSERWDLGARIRNVAIAPDGAVWVIEDGGNIVRLERRT